MALSVLDVYKLLPRQNCGDCGYKSCLAFATAAIKDGASLDGCLHLSDAADKIIPGLQFQQKAGIGRRRLSIENAVAAMHEKMAPLDFSPLAAGLGAALGTEREDQYLELSYFGHPYRIFKDRVIYPQGADDDPWDAVLLYNFVYSGGNDNPSGRWISMKDLKNSVSKAADIKELQTTLAAWTDTNFEKLKNNAEKIGGIPAALETTADLSLLFSPLVKIPVLLAFYKSEPAEGFPADAQFLFDSTIVSYLDMESIVFLTERIVKKLTALTVSRRQNAAPAA
jgi:hypothetical protein